jgi:hypothetical protein
LFITKPLNISDIDETEYENLSGVVLWENLDYYNQSSSENGMIYTSSIKKHFIPITISFLFQLLCSILSSSRLISSAVITITLSSLAKLLSKISSPSSLSLSSLNLFSFKNMVSSVNAGSNLIDVYHTSSSNNSNNAVLIFLEKHHPYLFHEITKIVSDIVSNNVDSENSIMAILLPPASLLSTSSSPVPVASSSSKQLLSSILDGKISFYSLSFIF